MALYVIVVCQWVYFVYYLSPFAHERDNSLILQTDTPKKEVWCSLSLHRPIAGFVNFCPVTIDGSQSDEYLLTVAKHEVLHALVWISFTLKFNI